MCACCYRREPDEEKEETGFFSSFFTSNARENNVSHGAGADDATGENHSTERSAETVRRHMAGCGENPNVLLYSINNIRPKPERRRRGSGSAPSTPSVPSSPVEGGRKMQEACHIPGNCREGVPIETDYFVGKVMLMYRTKTEPQSPHVSYFQSKKRNWEARVQGRFKRAPKGDMFVGIVLRDFNYDQEVASTSKWVAQLGMAPLSYLKYDLYWSWGDRRQAAMKSNSELCHAVSNCTAWDQIIITPARREPPPMGAELGDVGDSYGLNLMRNSMGLSGYGERMDEVWTNVSTEDTYTMCFWGVSQVIDLLNWNFRIGTGFSMARFFEDSPVHVVMYEYEKTVNGSDLEDAAPPAERRHLEKDKKYFLDFMFWANCVACPALPSRYIFRSAAEEFELFSASLNGQKAEAAVRGDIDLDEARTRAASPFVTAQSQAGDDSGDQRSREQRRSGSGEGQQRGRIAGLWERVSTSLRWIPDYTCARAEAEAQQREADSRRISSIASEHPVDR